MFNFFEEDYKNIKLHTYSAGCEGCNNAILTNGISCDTCINHCNYCNASEEELRQHDIQVLQHKFDDW